MRRNVLAAASLLMALAGISAFGAEEYSIRVTTDKDVAIYEPGETMEFTLLVLDGETPVGGKKLKWTRTGDDGKNETGEGMSDENGHKVTTSMEKPGFVRLVVHAYGDDGKRLQGYAGGWGANKQGEIFLMAAPAWPRISSRLSRSPGTSTISGRK